MAGRLLVVAAAAAAALLVATVLRAHASAAPPPRPNVVVLETDDQTLESMKVMAHTRRLLGDEGVTFDNNFVSFSLCCPSRSTFLTGQYAHNHGVLGNRPPEGGYYKLDSTNTLAVWLRRSGYYTVHLGKYLNGYGRRDPREIPPGWSEWHGSVDPSTYRYYGYTLNENGTLATYCAKPEPSCYQTDVYAEKAAQIIRARAAASQPFFLWVAFLAPHAGGPREPGDPAGLGTPVPAPRHKGTLASIPLPRPPSFNEPDVSDKPARIRNRPLLGPRAIEAIRSNYEQRLESLLAVDEAVEKIVTTLRETGQLERTLIVFTSDNGFFHGEHRVRAGKVLLYEPSIRVPLLIRGPGVPRGAHRSQLVANIDLAPTILAAAHAEPSRRMDGRSLWPLIADAGKEYGRDVLIENGPGPGHFSAIRSRHYLYAEYATGERELYDLRRDPDERQSRHADPAYAAVRRALAGRLARLRGCGGDACRARPNAILLLRAAHVSIRRSGTCHEPPVRAFVLGRHVRSVTFRANGRFLATDERAPFAARLSRAQLGGGRVVVRARIGAGVDRLVTSDQTITICPR